jgi:5-formyltetrahydrofolate cyclo-ligase
MNKQAIKKKMLLLRMRMNRKEVENKSAKIAKKLFGSTVFKKARRIMFYAAFKNEVETSGMIKRSLKMKKDVFVPKVKGGEIFAVKIKDFGELSRGKFGIKEPSERIIPLASPELKFDAIIVPGIAFDSKGNRLGFGGGYYDRFLKKTCGVKIGMAFDCQLMENLPVSENDVKMDMVITEAGMATPS